jgi:hypothetical protein
MSSPFDRAKRRLVNAREKRHENDQSAARPQSHDVSIFPHVQQAIKKASTGRYAEGVVRMLILLARAVGTARSPGAIRPTAARAACRGTAKPAR